MEAKRKYIFVCGLHRSGTTLLTEMLASHPEISGFQNTGAIENEGQFLQTVFPVENEFGGVGRFGFDPRSHMVEGSSCDNPEAAQRLQAEWSRHWDPTKHIVIEKTPSNMLRMRLLQRYFERSYFVVVTRHPLASALATVKWTQGNVFSLLYHWVHCYRLAREDAIKINRILWVSYERLILDPKGILEHLSAFLNLDPHFPELLKISDQNHRYFRLWKEWYFGDGNRRIAQQPPERYRTIPTRLIERIQLLSNERALPKYRRRANLTRLYDGLDAVAVLESAVNEFGYSLTDFNRLPTY